mmetsp:Transcript_33649/g.78720  ORF Transcript_33649/g.78720 Transcript_33649/m.78720 type:complete len:1205 (+) Transcript_33649:178-3792(+)
MGYGCLPSDIDSKCVKRSRRHALRHRLFSDGDNAAHLRRLTLGEGVHMAELGEELLPIVENGLRLLGAGRLHVLFDQLAQLHRGHLVHGLHLHVGVDPPVERIGLPIPLAVDEEVPPAASLARAHVAPDRAEHHHDAARHVLAAVVARPLDDRLRVRVAHAEALARPPAREEAPARGAVEARVADDDALTRLEGDRPASDAVDRADADAAAVHRLADVVVGVAAHLEVEPRQAAEAKRLAGAAGEDEVERAPPAAVAVLLGDDAGDTRRGRAVDVGDGRLDCHVLVLEDGAPHVVAREELVVERLLLRVRLRKLIQLRALLVSLEPRDLRDETEVKLARLGHRRVALPQQVRAADQLAERAVAERREALAHLVCRVDEEILGVARHAGELLAQLLLLCGDADRAVVRVADARDDAADGDHRDGAEAELVGAEQRAHDDVVAGLEPAVDAQHDAVAQPVEHELLVRLRQPQLPRPARVLDRRERRGARPAVVPRDLDDVRVRLGDARRDRADAHLRDELHGHLRLRVDLVQVIDQLREVLDRVDVVVGRRRDEHHAHLARADRGDVRVDLGAGELPPLAGLGALCHLDLDLLSAHQVGGRDAEAARRDLLHFGEGEVAVVQALEVGEGLRLALLVGVAHRRPPHLVLSALARVGAAARAVDAHGERLVRLAREGAQRHAARAEAPHDGLDGLHLLLGDGRAVRLDLQHVADDGHGGLLDVGLVQLVQVESLATHVGRAQRLVQLARHRRVPLVVLEPLVVLDEPVVDERLAVDELLVRVGVPLGGLFGDVTEGEASDARRRAYESRVDELLADADGLEDLRAVVRGEQGDADLGEDLEDPRLERLARVDEGLLERDIVEQTAASALTALVGLVQPLDRVEEQIRVDSRRAKADEAGDVVCRPRLPCLCDDGGLEAHARVDEVVVHGADSDKRRDEDIVDADAPLLPIGEHDDLRAADHLPLRLRHQSRHRRLEPIGPARDGVERRDVRRLLRAADALQLGRVEDGRRDAQLVGELRHGRVAQVAPSTEGHVEAHDDALAQRVNGRVGHLREALLEIVVERVRLLREHRQRRVLSEGEERLLARVRHVAHLHLQIFERPAEGRQQPDRVLGHLGLDLDVEGQLVDDGAPLPKPLGVRRLPREVELDRRVLPKLAAHQVERDHVARPQLALADDLLVAHVDHARLRHEPQEPVVSLKEARRPQPVAI